jgi:hypothetical protein
MRDTATPDAAAHAAPPAAAAAAGGGGSYDEWLQWYPYGWDDAGWFDALGAVHPWDETPPWFTS